MVKVVFEYKDEYTHGEWRRQECVVRSEQECISIYGLDKIEYKIISVEGVE